MTLPLETERLALRELTLEDADFLLELMNEPSYHRFIGDKGLGSLEDARAYLERALIEHYRQHGFGLYLVETRAQRKRVGICGLIRRASLADVDLGFAFLERWAGRGLATEAGARAMQHGREELGFGRIFAITDPDNAASRRVLAKLGFVADSMLRLAPDQPELCLLAAEPRAGAR